MVVRLCLFLALLALGCSPSTVGDVIRSDAPTASEALDEPKEKVACRDVKRARPLVVDWTSQDRLDLELAMKNGVAIVHYDCEGFRLLPACTLAGDYRFVGVSRKEDVVQITNADELAANLPLSAVKLEGEVSRDSSIDLALVMVGKKTTTVSEASRLVLDGDCEGATHFVRAAFIGAFAMDRGSAGKVRAVVDMFGAGARAGSESKKSTGTRDGELNACRSSKSSDEAPRDQCQAALRLDLEVLTDELPNKKKPAKKEETSIEAAVSACPEGLVESGGKCTERKSGSPYICAPLNAPECEAQCKAGSMESCFNFSKLLWRGSSVERDVQRALKLSIQACEGGAWDACSLVPSLVFDCERTDQGNCHADRLVPLRAKACEGGHGQSCYLLALWGKKGSPEQPRLYERACSLGYLGGCTTLGMSLVKSGAPNDLPRGLDILERACDGGAHGACNMLSHTYKKGVDGVKQNPAKALQADERLCALRSTRACISAAEAYASAPPGVMMDKARSLKLYRIACKVGRGNDAGKACNRLGISLRYKANRTPEEEKESFAALADGCHLAYLDCAAVARAAQLRAYQQDRKRCTDHDPEACNRLELHAIATGCQKEKKKSLCDELAIRDPNRLRAIRWHHCAASGDAKSDACKALVDAGGQIPPPLVK